MLYKKSKIISILFLFFVTSCSLYKNNPIAVSKPKKLQLVIDNNSDFEDQSYTYRNLKDINKTFNFESSSLSNLNTEEEIANFDQIKEEIEIQNLSTTNISENQKQLVKFNDHILRIGILLSKSQATKQIIDDIKNSSIMAIFDSKIDNTILQLYYLSNNTYDNLKVIDKIKYDNIDVLIGPLLSEEVKFIKNNIKDIPVISFTTDTKVLSNNIFSIGFLIEQQIKRIVEYTTQQNKMRFAVIIPDSETGDFIYENLKKYIYINNGDIIAVEKYKDKKKGLMEAVKKVSDFEKRSEECKEYKTKIQNRYNELIELKDTNYDLYIDAFNKDEYLSTDDELSALEKINLNIEKKTTISDPEYDAIFMFGDDINDVLMIGSSLMYYDVHPDKIKYIGLSQLENNKIYTERAFKNAWYPSVSTKYNRKFEETYFKLFNKKPVKIASLAYDAVSLVNLIQNDGSINISDLLNPNGWAGINGIFRFKYNGLSERNMDIKEIIGGSITKTKIISPAPLNFLE